jgi:hypothetical protein
MKLTVTLALSCLFVVFGCHRAVRVAAPPPPPPVPAALMIADDAFDQGDFTRAARSYDTFLDSHIVREDMDRILFRSAVSDSLSEAGGQQEKSSEVLNRLVRDYPQSPYTSPARIILNLRSDLAKVQGDYVKLQIDRDGMQKMLNDKIKQISDELESLKKIDLNRRRTP